MTKRETIDMIMEINRSARPEFLAEFEQRDLDLYLENLLEVDTEPALMVA